MHQRSHYTQLPDTEPGLDQDLSPTQSLTSPPHGPAFMSYSSASTPFLPRPPKQVPSSFFYTLRTHFLLSLLFSPPLPSAPSSSTSFDHPWWNATERAKETVKGMTIEEKVTVVTGNGWQKGPCVGNIDAIPRIGFKGINVAATFDKAIMLEHGESLGREFRDRGAHVALAPMMNLYRQGGDPYLSSISASLQVRGIQLHGVIATAKHLIANEQEHFRMLSSSNLDDRTLMEVYMMPFEACVEPVNGVYACENSAVVNHVLKGRDIDFQGFVMTDWWAAHSEVPTAMVSDMMMPGTKTFFLPLLLFRRLPHPQHPSREGEMLLKHKAHARRTAAASTVVLVNKGVLPIKEVKRISVLGEDAAPPGKLNRFTDRGGNEGTLAQGWGSGTTEFPYIVSPLKGITARAKKDGIDVVSHLSNWDRTGAVRTASNSELSIVFVNADSGEGYVTVELNAGDRNDLHLWHNGDKLIEAVLASNTPTVVVIHSVGPVEMPWIDHPNIAAVVFALLPGQESGNAIADILFGDTNPSGRLPFTIFKSRKDYAADVMYASWWPIPQIHYTEGLYIDHMHADKNNVDPLFAFGHGLSYSDFAYTDLKVNVTSIHAADIVPASHLDRRTKHALDTSTGVSVSVTITNVDKMAGHEVVQLYIAFPEAAQEPPKLLRGFERVNVEGGKSVTVKFEVGWFELRVWGVVGSREWGVVKGEYGVIVGASSRDVRVNGKFEVV
ncbi:glycosyl hydrolase family 3 C-terminal domain-containing protein [Chytridium lagenaria]|nr:glycosyl hydrolase family 3 C-terminal domain-containing protein [Chytridium lagenaria]